MTRGPVEMAVKWPKINGRFTWGYFTKTMNPQNHEKYHEPPKSHGKINQGFGHLKTIFIGVISLHLVRSAKTAHLVVQEMHQFLGRHQ